MLLKRQLTSLARRNRWLVAGAVSAAILLVGVGAAVTLRPSQPEATDLCDIAANEEYAALVDRLLADYLAVLADPESDADAQVGNAGEYGFTPLFQMRACSIDEEDLAYFPFGLQQIIYDPAFHSDAWPAPPIDIEVAWYAELGVEGLITGWSTTARLAPSDAVAEVQRLLSFGLAHTTNPDRRAILAAGVYPDLLVDRDRYLDDGYVAAFVDLGGQRIELARYRSLRWAWGRWGTYLFDEPGDWELSDRGPRVHGWSVLAPLLRYGEFHERFLAPVATAIVEFDQDRQGEWGIEGEEPVSFDTMGGDPGNAMDAVLAALSRNRSAAEAVFEATGDPRVQRLLNGR
jgi:hypothetical protein